MSNTDKKSSSNQAVNREHANFISEGFEIKLLDLFLTGRSVMTCTAKITMVKLSPISFVLNKTFT